MVAHEGEHPIAVLHACKRPHATLILRLAVHPEHRRRGHGRHLLTSLSKKLAILGPPQLQAEIPGDRRTEAHAFLEACGYVEQATLTDWVREGSGDTERLMAWSPVTVEQLQESGALEDLPALAWERTAATLLARKDALHGLALASEERIQGWALWREAGDTAEVWGARGLVPPLGWDRVLLPKLAEAEVPAVALERDGFRPGRRTLLYGARAAAA
jgi:GNAT superfamily N-acetyltransferase